MRVCSLARLGQAGPGWALIPCHAGPAWALILCLPSPPPPAMRPQLEPLVEGQLRRSTGTGGPEMEAAFADVGGVAAWRELLRALPRQFSHGYA